MGINWKEQMHVEEEQRALKILRKHTKTPIEVRELGAWVGLNFERARSLLYKFRKKGLVKFSPAKKCPTCGHVLLGTAGYIYVGPKEEPCQKTSSRSKSK
jgi:hypothetical protein